MAGVQDIKHSAERAAMGALIDGFLKNLKSKDDRTETYLKIVDLAEKFYGSGANKDTIAAVRAYVKNPDNRWMRFINRVVDETDPHYAKMMLLNLGYEAFFRGTKMIRENRKKYNCNIPWLILFDPTMACNMHCVGCWSGTYGIVTEGKELGAHLYMMTGGEPTVRMNDIFKLAEKHNDCFFGLYSNSTLITDELAERVRELGNITFMLSIEGTPDTNDARRGEGHYAKVMNAMDILKKHGIVFGTSICYTRANIEAVTSDDFFHLLEEKGGLLLPSDAGRQQCCSGADAYRRTA